MKLIKKKKTLPAFLSSHKKTSENLGKRETLWEHESVLRVPLFNN